VQAVYIAKDPSNGQSGDQQDQGMCTAFSQDHHVVIALLPYEITETGLTCLEKAGIVSIAQGYASSHDDVILRKYPHYFVAGAVSLTRVPTILVDALAAAGYLKDPGAKFGLVYVDSPSFKRNLPGLVSALAHYGAKLTDSAGVPPVNNFADIGANQAPLKSAVLRFASQGINHVLFFDDGVASGLFMIQAASQNYNPRYGVQGGDLSGQQAVPASQFKGTVGVGWSPAHDLNNPPPMGAGARQCADFEKAHGQDYYALNMDVCQHVDTLARAVTAAGSITPDTILAALPKIQPFEPAAGFLQAYPNGQKDGMVQAARVAYIDSCGCFEYSSKPYAV
jgi:ABC-type branched-subunit amino acid transport system substrate-binding protein